MENEKKPQPLFSDVLIKNPLANGVVDEIEKEAKKLPEKQRGDYLKEQMSTMWGKVEILLVGPDCRALTEGDFAVADPGAVSSSIPTPDNQFLFVSERAFKGKW